MNFDIPRQIKEIMDAMNRAGHQIFIVGGCLRDILMEKTPEDWDLCTSALPEETKVCFRDKTTIDIGIDHGTVAVVVDKKPVEITTYRIDGAYFDRRHPEDVAFTTSIEEDLARRDFTVNAMAYNKEDGFVDPFDGQEDIKKKILRCVGDPQKRFDEDALRILRCLRFAATLGFTIDEATEKAMMTCKDGLKYISVERINVEFSKLIKGEWAEEVIKDYGEIIKVFAPELRGQDTYAIRSRTGGDVAFLATVFRGNVETAMRRLKFTKKMINLGKAVDAGESRDLQADVVGLKNLLRQFGPQVLAMILDVKENYGEDMSACREMMNEILQSGQCYSISGLAIDGETLMEAGFTPGPEIGKMLNVLLDYVIEHPEANKKETLLKKASR